MRLLAAAVVCLILSSTLAPLPVVATASTASDAAVTAKQPEAEQPEAKQSDAAQPLTAADADALPTEQVPAEPADATKAATKAAAAEETAVQRPTAGLGLGKMALSLGIVVAIVLLLGWTFKKLTLRLPGSRHIKIISAMPLGPKERLLVIEMQGKQRVLGVTAHNINLLFELEKALPEEKLASDFHTQLQSFLKK